MNFFKHIPVLPDEKFYKLNNNVFIITNGKTTTINKITYNSNNQIIENIENDLNFENKYIYKFKYENDKLVSCSVGHLDNVEVYKYVYNRNGLSVFGINSHFDITFDNSKRIKSLTINYMSYCISEHIYNYDSTNNLISISKPLSNKIVNVSIPIQNDNIKIFSMSHKNKKYNIIEDKGMLISIEQIRNDKLFKCSFEYDNSNLIECKTRFKTLNSEDYYLIKDVKYQGLNVFNKFSMYHLTGNF